MKKTETFFVFFLIALLFGWAGFLSGQTSGTPVNVSRSSYASTEARVAVNQHGEVMVVWVENIGSNKQIYYSYRRGSSWSNPAAIPGQSHYNIRPDVYRGRGGGFVAAWHDVANGDCIRFSEFTGTTWTTPLQVSQNGGYEMGQPRIITSPGRILVAWERGNPIWRDIYVSIWDGSWRGISQISYTPLSASSCLSLAMGTDGRAYVAWQNAMDHNIYDEKIEIIWNADNGKGVWPHESFLTNFEDWLFRPTIAVNNYNDILITFYFFNQGGYTSYVRRGGSWSALQYIGTSMGEHELYFSQSAPFGDGFIFIYRDRGYNIVYSIYRSGSWSQPTAISEGYNNYHPSVSYHSSLGIAAAWTNRDNNNVYVKVFNLNSNDPEPEPEPEPELAPVEPPVGVRSQYYTVNYTTRNLQVEKIVNRNLFTVKYLNRVSWERNHDLDRLNADIYKFRIYRRRHGVHDFVPVKEVDAGVFSYLDEDQVGPENDLEYLVKGVDNLQNESYKFNSISWQRNPANDANKLVITNYRVYRRIRGTGDSDYQLCHQSGANDFSWTDLDVEIRRGRLYDYAATALDEDGRESERTVAVIQEIVTGTDSAPAAGKGKK